MVFIWTILYSSQQRRKLFQGHLHYFDFEKYAPLYYPNTTSILPNWILDLYGRQYPQAPLQIPQFTTLRNPQLRLASTVCIITIATALAMMHGDKYFVRTVAMQLSKSVSNRMFVSRPKMIFRGGAISKRNCYVDQIVCEAIHKKHSIKRNKI